jgi:hypothetical protein
MTILCSEAHKPCFFVAGTMKQANIMFMFIMARGTADTTPE